MPVQNVSSASDQMLIRALIDGVIYSQITLFYRSTTSKKG